MRFVVVRGPEIVGPFELVPGPNIIGRDPTAHVRLPSRRVSRRHAIVIPGQTRVVIRDLDSSNGLVDEAGQRLVELELVPGKRVQIGDFVLRLEDAEELELEPEAEADDPATVESELQLEDEDEDTPVPSGPMPVVRHLQPARGGGFPDPGSATLDGIRSPVSGSAGGSGRGSPGKGGRSKAGAAPPALPATVAPPPASVERPAFPPPPSVGSASPALPSTITAVPPVDMPSAETSGRMPPPVLPFGPPTGGFASFGAPASRPAPAPRDLPREDDTPFATRPPPEPPAPVTPPAPTRVSPTPAAPAAAPPALPALAPPLPRYAEDPQSAEVGARASTRIPPIRAPEPPREPSAGLPWAVQAGAVLMLAGAVLVCAPVGGVFGQVWRSTSAAEELSLQRGEALAVALGERNATPLAEQRLIGLDTSFILHEPGVQEAAVTDAAGSVLAPPERAHTSVARTDAFLAAVQSHDSARAEGDDGAWELVTPIRGEVSTGSGARTIVGWTWLRYDPTVAANAVTSPWIGAFSGIFVVLAAAAIVVAGGFVLVVRPLAALRDETEHAVLDHVDKVVSPVRWPILEALAHSINRAITRARER